MNNYILPFLWMKGESEDVIREEIEKISECGIGAVCLESRPHPDFMGEKWWSDMRLILEECKKRDMKIWILDDAHFPTGYANGLVKDKYPHLKKWYLNYSTCDVWGARDEVSLQISKMIHPTFSFLELGQPRNLEEEANNVLFSVSAYRLIEENQVDESSAIDLTDQVRDDWLNISLPEGSWRVYVVYKTRNGGANPDYLNPIDRESAHVQIEAVYEPHYEHFREEFGKTILGFFSDEPGFYNKGGFGMDERIGHKEMVLPWSEAAEARMEAACGADYKTWLPLLWNPSVQDRRAASIRCHYMDVVTALYSECFCGQLGEWCAAHNVEYIGHVLEDDNVHARLGAGAGHYFRAVAGQHMAGIDVISQQITPGGAELQLGGSIRRGCEFNHYAMAKMGASSGHLDPKKKGRTMCELFGAYGWRLGVRDMKWILDHLLAKGVNYFVPHAFSMSDYPDGDCPPHYYARGHYSQFEAFGELMRYANRMSDFLNGGQHVASTALLYHAESEWAGEAMLMQKPARELVRHQLEFDIVSLDMLAHPEKFNGRIDEHSFTINGITFDRLIVPYTEKIANSLVRFMQQYPEIPVIFVDAFPVTIADCEVQDGEALQQYVDQLADGAAHQAVALESLGELISCDAGAREITLSAAHPEMVYYHYRKDGEELYLLHNEDLYRTYAGSITLPLKNGAVLYDGMRDQYYSLPCRAVDGGMEIEAEIPVFGMWMILDRDAAGLPAVRFAERELSACTEQIDLSSDWNYRLYKQITPEVTEAEGHMETLEPMSHRYPMFSGHIVYEKEFTLQEKPAQAYLLLEHVVETVRITLNGQRLDTLLTPPYRAELGAHLRAGVNRLEITVTTTMDRDQLQQPEPPFIMDYQPLEATGMYGKVELCLRKQ